MPSRKPANKRYGDAKQKSRSVRSKIEATEWDITVPLEDGCSLDNLLQNLAKHSGDYDFYFVGGPELPDGKCSNLHVHAGIILKEPCARQQVEWKLFEAFPPTGLYLKARWQQWPYISWLGHHYKLDGKQDPKIWRLKQYGTQPLDRGGHGKFLTGFIKRYKLPVPILQQITDYLKSDCYSPQDSTASETTEPEEEKEEKE